MDMPVVYVPGRLCAQADSPLQREWLVTNGLGGFAAGTLAGGLTRRYHGLLIAALRPPLGRTLLVAKLDETLTVAGRSHALYTNIWQSGVEQPPGCSFIRNFELVAGVPTWHFEIKPQPDGAKASATAGCQLDKRIWMEPGLNTTYVQYLLHRQSPACTLLWRCLVNYRDYHHLTPHDQRIMQVDPRPHGLRIDAGGGAAPFVIATAVDANGSVQWQREHVWYRDLHLPFEQSVGYEHADAHLCAGTCVAHLEPGETITLVLSVEPDIVDAVEAGNDLRSAVAGSASRAKQRPRESAGAAAFNRRLRYAADRLQECERAAQADWLDSRPLLRQLVLAADQFVVTRPAPDAPDGHTIIAGYPWFTDWGRDTMISLPGLTLITGRYEIARQILKTWARHVDRGTIPNRFPDAGDTPEYNTADATLWYLWAIDQYVRASGDRETLAELYPVMCDIVAWHLRGTRHNICVGEDGLVHAGEPGVQLTWMDAKVDGRVITPREGKPVELSALWYDGLCNLTRLARSLNKSADAERFAALAARTKTSFARFWNPQRGCCYDVLDGHGADTAADGSRGADARVQVGQIFSVSLEHSPLSPEQQAAVVGLVERELLTWFGLRTLPPYEPRYHGIYRGRLVERDEAYHQGTAWGWLLGPFVLAHYRVHRDASAAREFLSPILGQLYTHAIGSLAEIFDGDAPHTPRGCVAQAWSVAETLRALSVVGGG